MELASMLAGEPFSDHPRCVSPAIAAFLRRYNDILDDESRQDLYALAAKVVDTAASAGVETARADRLTAWADDMWDRRCRRSILARARRRRARRLSDTESEATAAAAYAAGAISGRPADFHPMVLALLDELIAMGQRRRFADWANVTFASEAYPIGRVRRR
jgi:hypothetical protein